MSAIILHRHAIETTKSLCICANCANLNPIKCEFSNGFFTWCLGNEPTLYSYDGKVQYPLSKVDSPTRIRFFKNPEQSLTLVINQFGIKKIFKFSAPDSNLSTVSIQYNAYYNTQINETDYQLVLNHLKQTDALWTMEDLKKQCLMYRDLFNYGDPKTVYRFLEHIDKEPHSWTIRTELYG